MSKEPVAIGSAVVALVNSVLAALVLLDIANWSSEQVAGLNLVVVNVVVLVTAVLSRSKVTPTEGG